MAYRTPFERFWSKVDQSGGLFACWLWTASTNRPPGDPAGYGLFSLRESHGVHRNYLAHRLAYKYMVGPIPEGLTIDHLCFVRRCVNPLHLEAVTMRENTLRSRKPYCRHGHLYTDENTIRTKRGARRCRSCLVAQGRLRSRDARAAGRFSSPQED